MLERLGYDVAQGFLFAQADDQRDFIDLLASRALKSRRARCRRSNARCRSAVPDTATSRWPRRTRPTSSVEHFLNLVIENIPAYGRGQGCQGPALRPRQPLRRRADRQSARPNASARTISTCSPREQAEAFVALRPRGAGVGRAARHRRKSRSDRGYKGTRYLRTSRCRCSTRPGRPKYLARDVRRHHRAEARPRRRCTSSEALFAQPARGEPRCGDGGRRQRARSSSPTSASARCTATSPEN